MDHRIHHLKQHPLAINQTQKKAKVHSNGVSFKDHLNNSFTKSENLVISKHAQKRLTERQIVIDDKTWSKIETRLQEAKQKGVMDSLVVTSEAALLVSAKNNTVITAMNRDEASSQIFTNINGTILMDE